MRVGGPSTGSVCKWRSTNNIVSDADDDADDADDDDDDRNE